MTMAKKIRRNRKGEEIGTVQLRIFLLWHLEQCGGWTTGDKLEAAVWATFGKMFGPDDLKLMRVGRHSKRPKWKNSLDWAKAQATKMKRIHLRSEWREGRKITYI